MKKLWIRGNETVQLFWVRSRETMKILWGRALLSGVLFSLLMFCFNGMSHHVYNVWYYIFIGVMFGVGIGFGVKRKRRV